MLICLSGVIYFVTRGSLSDGRKPNLSICDFSNKYNLNCLVAVAPLAAKIGLYRFEQAGHNRKYEVVITRATCALQATEDVVSPN